MKTFGRNKKMTRLEMLQQKSANAVSLIRSTITSLRETNEAIDDEQVRNVNRIAALTATNSSLEALRTDNEKVIANFEKLLS
jgi:hypothetical protein